LPPVAEGYFPPNLPEILEKHARVQCEQVLAGVGLSQARVLLLHGSPAGEISRAAADEQVDLIIVGTQWARGDCASACWDRSPNGLCGQLPVRWLTVRPGEHEFVVE